MSIPFHASIFRLLLQEISYLLHRLNDGSRPGIPVLGRLLSSLASQS